VTQVSGKNLFMVDYKIETCISECPTYGSQLSKSADNPVVSHRWQSALTVDEQFFSVLLIEGRIKFRTDWLTATNSNQLADAFRSQFFHPIPFRFKREQINVRASSDGSEIAYTIMDREQPISLGLNSPATKIEAFYSVVSQTPSRAEAGEGAKPFLSGNVAVRVWGRPGQINWNLYRRALAIAVYKLHAGRVYKWSVREALHSPYIELEATAFYPPSATADVNLLPLTATNFKPVSLDPVPGVLVRAEAHNPRPGDRADGQPAPGGGAHSRGWAAIKLLTAALKVGCEQIPQPRRGVNDY
jgi:hypothetical protein